MTGKKTSKQKALDVIDKRAKAMANIMTEVEVIEFIKARQGEDSLRGFAEKLGVSASYLSDTYCGRRSPGAKLLEYFGIGKTRRTIVEYVFFKK